MPLYEFYGTDTDGVEYRDQIDAQSEDEARHTLGEMGYTIQRLRLKRFRYWIERVDQIFRPRKYDPDTSIEYIIKKHPELSDFLEQMNAYSTRDWTLFRLGDRVRVVRIPSLFSESRYHNEEWEKTLALYRQLITDSVVLTITNIDEDGRPWTEYESTDEDGTKISRALATDDDSWERVD